jgi:hypothetical protein
LCPVASWCARCSSRSPPRLVGVFLLLRHRVPDLSATRRTTPCQTFLAPSGVCVNLDVRRFACPRPESSRVLHAGRHPGAAREVGLPQRPLAAPFGAKTAPAADQPSARHQCRSGGLEDATGSAGRIHATTCSHGHRCVFKASLYSCLYPWALQRNFIL